MRAAEFLHLGRFEGLWQARKDPRFMGTLKPPRESASRAVLGNNGGNRRPEWPPLRVMKRRKGRFAPIFIRP